MEEEIIYINKNYSGPLVIDLKPSKELKEYHENSYIQLNVDGKTFSKKVKNENRV